METVRSADGTQIAFRRSGSGPPLVLVHGSTADHTRWAGVLPDLERAFTVIAMDRRGRGAIARATCRRLDRGFHKPIALIIFDRRVFSGSSEYDDRFDAAADLELDKASERVVVEAAVRRERRDDCRAGSSK